jgi:hypothetical protein
LHVIYIGGKPYSTTINTLAGWTAISGTNGTNGTTESGVDVGSVHWAAFYRYWQTGDTATPTFSITSGNVTLGLAVRYRPTAGSAINVPVGAKGSDTSSGLGYSATMDANPGIKAGDALRNFTTIAGNNASFATPTITITGATLSTVTESPSTEGSTTTGNDLEASCSAATVTAGTASAAAVVGWALSQNQTGGGALIRVSETRNVVLTPASFSATAVQRTALLVHHEVVVADKAEVAQASLLASHASTQNSIAMEAREGLQARTRAFGPSIAAAKAAVVLAALLTATALPPAAEANNVAHASIKAELLVPVASQAEIEVFGGTSEAAGVLAAEASLLTPTAELTIEFVADLLTATGVLLEPHIDASTPVTIDFELFRFEPTIEICEPDVVGEHGAEGLALQATGVLLEPSIQKDYQVAVGCLNALGVLPGTLVSHNEIVQVDCLVAEGVLPDAFWTGGLLVRVMAGNLTATAELETFSTSASTAFLVGHLHAVARLHTLHVYFNTGWTWGEEHPLVQEGAPWDEWKDALGSPAVFDSSWGRLQLLAGETFYSSVKDFRTAVLKHLEIVVNAYQTGTGIGTIEWRGSATSFAWDAVLPAWEPYASGTKAWRYVQVRVTA